MKTWTVELTVDELIALARACTDYQEKLISRGWLTAEDMFTINRLEAIDDKFPDESWFPDEVKP